MVAVGGNSEQKPIGLKFGVSGTHNDTELVNGKVQLKQIGVDWDNSHIYSETGTWTSDIIDIGDNFADFGKVFTSNINQGNSSITIETRTSSNGTTFDEWKFVDLDGTILSQKNKYIQVRVNFFVDKSVKEKVITNFNSDFIDSSNGIKLKTEYNFDMTKDGTWLEEGSLHKKPIVRSDWQQIDKLNSSPTVGKDNKHLILNKGEYKKFEKYDYTSIKNPLEVNSLTNYFTFDEENGNVTDSKGTAVGTVYNAPTRVTGWNGEGKAMNFNGTNQYVSFNEKVIPIGEKSIRFKIKVSTKPTLACFVFSTSNAVSSTHGDAVTIRSNGSIGWNSNRSISDSYRFYVESNFDICDNKWHDILLTWDGTTNVGAVKIYVDDLITPKSVGEAISMETLSPTNNLVIGRASGGTNYYYFNGQIDNLEFYNKVLTHDDLYNKNNQDGWLSISSVLPNKQLFLSDGVDLNSSLLNRDIAVLNPLSMTDKGDTLTESGKVFSVILDLKKYMDIRNLSTNVTGQIKLCNVGDYENTIEYTNISDIYDNFNGLVEVLVFTDSSVIEADLILEANWSPIDELEGDFEVVTWTDEDKTTAQRTLEMTATPVPQFIYPTTATNIVGDLQSLNIQGDGKFLLTHNNSQWFKWNGTDFVTVNAQNASTEGMTSQEITSADYSKWIYDKINIGLFIENNDVVNHIGISQLLPNKTSQLSNINFYILNTTARIDLELAGLSLTGSLSDADLTRVQYKVTLNGEPFFPKNGEWTTLSEPPQNINITMKTSDIKMMDWNTLRVDFKDFFGTEDYWQTTFVGNYASLMFKDTDGNYYSDDAGEVLQYLDFGNIVAGEVTVSHEIILKNQYGYAVKDIEIVPNTSYLPEGVLIEMSKTNDPFIPESELLYTEGLADNEELSFFVRMNTDVNSIPNEHNKFDVFVKASRKDV